MRADYPALCKRGPWKIHERPHALLSSALQYRIEREAHGAIGGPMSAFCVGFRSHCPALSAHMPPPTVLEVFSLAWGGC